MAATGFQALPLYRPSAIDRAWGSIRYMGVLTVWFALFLARPALAVDIWRQRRADSPIPRFRSA